MTPAGDGTFETYPRLLGLRIADAPPIVEVFLDMSPGLVVAYGRNGAGKTRLLQGIEDALRGGEVKGCRELSFQWLPPTKRPLACEWWRLSGNPWASALADGKPDPRYADGDAIEGFQDKIEQFDTLAGFARNEHERVESAPLVNYARHIGFRSEFFLGTDRVIKACAEIASQGLFRLTRGRWRPGIQAGSRLVPCGIATASSPSLMSISNDLRAELIAQIERDGTVPSLDEAESLVSDIASDLETYGFLAFEMKSVALSVVGGDRPWWYADTFGGEIYWADGLAPCELLMEEQVDLHGPTLTAIENLLRQHSGGDQVAPGQTSILVGDRNVYEVHPGLSWAVEQVSSRASRYFSTLMEDAPIIECRVHDPRRWPSDGVVSWIAIDPSGAEIPIDSLSRAQQRWANFAVRLALHSRDHRLPLVLLLDEPEAALHRRAERFLVQGLSELVTEFDATAVVATHSPAFLGQPEARLTHVHRGPLGTTQLSTMPPDLRDRLRDLGLDPADLLQHCRTVVLVEGQHELVIFDELFRSELASAGAELFSMRGLKNLKNASDAQLLFRFTNARLLIVLDNEDSDRINDIWHRACEALDNHADPLPVIGELTAKGWSGEAKFLQEYMSLAVFNSERHRVRFCAMSLPDIPEYLPVHSVSSNAPADATWTGLRERHAKAAGGMDFKKWMTREYGADYSDDGLRHAVQDLDQLHPDLTLLLAAITTNPRRA